MERKDGTNRGHGHPKSQRWFEISTAVNVRFKHYKVIHLSRVKLTWTQLFLPWGLTFCLQISRPLSGLACRLFRIRKRFPRSDPPSKIMYRFLTIRFAQCLSFGIRHSFELIATERIAEFVPFRMETRAWPALTWGQLNIAIPIKARFTFWFYKGLCKQNVSLHGGVSHFTALENSIRAVGLKITKTTPGGAGNDLWSCRFSAFHDRPSWESVNHSRTIASMLETGWEQLKQVRLRSHSAVWSEFAFGPFGHCFLCCNQFFSWVMWSLRFPFFWSCFCHCMRFTTQRTRSVNIDCRLQARI